MNIDDPELERLAAEVAGLAGESPTEAIRQALIERRYRLRAHETPGERRARLVAFLERDIWPRIPPSQLGKMPDRAERELLLGNRTEAAPGL